MSASLEAIVTVLHEKFWSEDGRLVRAVGDDIAVQATQTFGDVVAETMWKLRDCPRAVAMCEALDEQGEWDDEDLVRLETLMEDEGII